MISTTGMEAHTPAKSGRSNAVRSGYLTILVFLVAFSAALLSP
jgi:hypothetical protein